MRHIGYKSSLIMISILSIELSACSSMPFAFNDYDGYSSSATISSTSTITSNSNYYTRMPNQINTNGKVIIVDPSVHAWGAYESNQLVRAGQVTAGSSWCPDLNRPCRTRVGSFRIHSLGSADCKSSIFPLPKGGAPMPYCMFFNGGQALHGSHEVVDGNVSHGCVRLHVADAEWLRFNFANIGTKVVIKPY